MRWPIVLILIVLMLTGMFVAAAAFAQTTPASPSACGLENVNYKVKLDDTQHTPAPADAGKARVYFIHDAGTDHTLGYPTVKMAVDGAWTGANHGNSYFSVSLAPGEHHLCVALQSSIVDQRFELAHFTAAADAVYYYRTRLVASRQVELLELNAVDSDQAKYLIGTFPLSISSPKK